jgi:hypothetical protein
MRPWTALPLLLAIACTACGGDDDDGDSGNTCSPDMCYATCEQQHAEDLEECNDICGIEAHCTTDDVCSCHFYPCYNPACEAWCQDHYDVGGACDLLACECF